jgi:hypothetical protein
LPAYLAGLSLNRRQLLQNQTPFSFTKLISPLQ